VRDQVRALIKALYATIVTPAHLLALFLDPLFVQFREASRASAIKPYSEMEAAVCMDAAKRLVRAASAAERATVLTQVTHSILGTFPVLREPAVRQTRQLSPPHVWWELQADSSPPELRSVTAQMFSRAPTSASAERSFKQRSRVHNKMRNRLSDINAGTSHAIIFNKRQARHFHGGVLLKPRTTRMESHVLDVLSRGSSGEEGGDVYDAVAGSNICGGVSVEVEDGGMEDDEGDDVLALEIVQSVAGAQELISRMISDAEAENVSEKARKHTHTVASRTNHRRAAVCGLGGWNPANTRVSIRGGGTWSALQLPARCRQGQTDPKAPAPEKSRSKPLPSAPAVANVRVTTACVKRRPCGSLPSMVAAVAAATLREKRWQAMRPPKWRWLPPMAVAARHVGGDSRERRRCHRRRLTITSGAAGGGGGVDALAQVGAKARRPCGPPRPYLGSSSIIYAVVGTPSSPPPPPLLPQSCLPHCPPVTRGRYPRSHSTICDAPRRDPGSPRPRRRLSPTAALPTQSHMRPRRHSGRHLARAAPNVESHTPPPTPTRWRRPPPPPPPRFGKAYGRCDSTRMSNPVLNASPPWRGWPPRSEWPPRRGRLPRRG